MAAREKAESRKDVLRIAKEHHVKFIKLWFTDILGLLKSFAITVEELEGALEEGMGFDGSAIEGWAKQLRIIIEMTRMGKLIAHHMVDSIQTSAHVQSFIEADVTKIWNWRKKS